MAILVQDEKQGEHMVFHTADEIMELQIVSQLKIRKRKNLINYKIAVVRILFG